MPKNSEAEIVRRNADQIPATSAEDMARLLAIPDKSIDTSDIPERTGERRRLRRDVDGRLPKRRSKIREKIIEAMQDRGMTTYALWKEARTFSPTISETAVGQFLKGERSIGIEYLEAIMEALSMGLFYISSSKFPTKPAMDAAPIDRTPWVKARSGKHG
jgi:hypothetical protein